MKVNIELVSILLVNHYEDILLARLIFKKIFLLKNPMNLFSQFNANKKNEISLIYVHGHLGIEGNENTKKERKNANRWRITIQWYRISIRRKFWRKKKEDTLTESTRDGSPKEFLPTFQEISGSQ